MTIVVDEVSVKEVMTGHVIVVNVVLTLGGYSVFVTMEEIVDNMVLVAALRVRRGPWTVVLTVLVECSGL